MGRRLALYLRGFLADSSGNVFGVKDSSAGNNYARKEPTGFSRLGSRSGFTGRVMALSMFGSMFALMITATPGVAGDVSPGDIKFMEDNSKVMASISGKSGDAVAGRKLFSNRKLGNCLACHVNSDMKEHSFHGEVGPSLDGVSERYDASELRAILIDSKKALNEDTIMPGFYSLDLGVRVTGKFKDKTVLNAQQVEDVLAYLQTLK